MAGPPNVLEFLANPQSTTTSACSAALVVTVHKALFPASLLTHLSYRALVEERQVTLISADSLCRELRSGTEETLSERLALPRSETASYSIWSHTWQLECQACMATPLVECLHKHSLHDHQLPVCSASKWHSLVS